MPTPRAQELNQFISFMNTTTGIGVDNVATETTTYATAWAKITAGGGSVGEATQQHQDATQDFEVWCRYNSGVTGWMQISWGTRTLSIMAPPQKITDANGRNWMLIQAQEVTERDLTA